MFNTSLLYALFIFILITCLFLAVWKMLEFRNRLHQFISNSQWEKRLEQHGFFSDENNSLVFFGDSQIALWWICPFFGTMPIKNRGISGERACDALVRFDNDVLSSNPNIVLILTGANDLRHGRNEADIVLDIEKMVLKCLTNSITVVLGSLLPSAYDVADPESSVKISSLNTMLKKLSEKYDVNFLDFYQCVSDRGGYFSPEFTDDGTHPNMSGYLIMSKLFQDKFIDMIKINQL